MIKNFYTINVILLSLGKISSKNSPNPWWMATKPGENNRFVMIM